MSRAENVAVLADFFASHEIVQASLAGTGVCRCGWIGGYHPAHLAEAAADAGIGSAEALTDEDMARIGGLGLPGVGALPPAVSMRAALAWAFGKARQGTCEAGYGT